ncbi:ATP-dependent RNA helicase DDX28 [Sarotherodon galilaeus]
MASIVLNTLTVVLFLDLTLCRGSPLESHTPSAYITANTLEFVTSGDEELPLPAVTPRPGSGGDEELALTAVTPRPASAGDEELATIDYGQPTQARDNATWVQLACPTDNADHFTTTAWYTCSNNDELHGIFRIDNGGELVTYSTQSRLAPAGMYNITYSTALSITEREACSQDRVFVCRRWAKVGRQNQCWFFRIKNCTVDMSPTSQYPCRCTPPRSTVTTMSSKSPSFTPCGLAWLMCITTLIINM